MIISIFTPHGGCPERCSFCDQSVSGGEPSSVSKVQRTIDEHLTTALPDTPVSIAFYGGTFTAFSKELQIRYLEACRPYLESGKVKEIRLATRPDHLDPLWMIELKEKYCVRTIELGVQSVHPVSLKALGRSHSVEAVEQGTALLKDLGFKVGHHYLLGVPLERQNEDQYTLEFILKTKPDFIRLHPLLVLKDTELAQDYSEGRFMPLELEDAIERAVFFLENLEKSFTKVIRLGLQPNELLSQSILAGPYHPSFGELVYSRILRNQLEKELLTTLKTRQIPSFQAPIHIYVPPEKESQLRGQKNSNLEWLTERFQLSRDQLCVLKGPKSNDEKTPLTDHGKTNDLNPIQLYLPSIYRSGAHSSVSAE